MSSSLWCNGRLLSESLETASSAVSRGKGWLGRDGVPAGAVLMLQPARQVHTVGMRFPIDVAFCSRDGRVLHVVRCMRPFRITRFVWKARRALETSAGGFEQVSVGDLLEVR